MTLGRPPSNGRPKSTTTVTVDAAVLRCARDNRINVSKVLEERLIEVLTSKNILTSEYLLHQSKMKEIEKEINKMNMGQVVTGHEGDD